MQTAERYWTPAGWQGDIPVWAGQAQLVLYFAAPAALTALDPWDDLRRVFPAAHIVGCSTGGEILGRDAHDDSIVCVAIHFEKGMIAAACQPISAASQSRAAGAALASALPVTLHNQDLKAVFVLSDGTLTNGSALIAGLQERLPAGAVITGGLAGDGPHFGPTKVGFDATPAPGQAAIIGFYGDALKIGWGSVGGWEPFGPERLISRSSANILYELDGEPALDLYKRYLGEEAANLPGSALFFPLAVRAQDAPRSQVVRTIVGVDDAAKALVFAGDIPQGYIAQLMRGNSDDLTEGAGQAGEAAHLNAPGAQLALLVSCIGRKLLMGQEAVDEVEAVADALRQSASVIGFYSYGEIAPHGFTQRCELHNQTMTVTTIGED